MLLLHESQRIDNTRVNVITFYNGVLRRKYIQGKIYIIMSEQTRLHGMYIALVMLQIFPFSVAKQPFIDMVK